MLKNYIRIAFRNIYRQKGYSFINITGLAIGMVCCIFLLLWVQDELSFDKFHKNADDIYRVELESKTPTGTLHINSSFFALVPTIKESIPEAKNTTRTFQCGNMIFRYGERIFTENNVLLVDPSFLQMFSFPLLSGGAETVLKNPFSILISEKISKKYFDNGDPVGKIIILDNKYSFTVTGILQNAPSNSTLQPEILLPMEFMNKIPGEYDLGWGETSWATWIQVENRSNVFAVNEKITNILFRNLKNESISSFLMPLKDIRLHELGYGIGKKIGTAQNVYSLTALAVLILLIACINFVNLTTARSANRAKEVGVRKVVGALRKNIIIQFFSESILITIIALVFALIIVVNLIPLFNNISGKIVTPGSLMNWNFMLGLVGVVLLTATTSGIYPALMLSLFQPTRVLKGSIRSSAKSGWLRKILVVIQFCISVILLVGTIVVYQQTQFMQNKQIGYDKEQLIYIPLTDENQKSFQILKEELLKDPNVQLVSGSSQTPTLMGRGISGGTDWDGRNPEDNSMIRFGQVDFNYIETMKIEMFEGRSFSKMFATDTTNAVLINQALMKMMGTEPAIGKRFAFKGVSGLKATEGRIIGVMKDFHYRKIQNSIEPLALFVSPNNISYAIVRLPTGDILSSLESVRSTWKKLFPNSPLEYRFFDQDFERMFQSEKSMQTLLMYPTILAIFIACLGLFGLTSFMTERRSKEIGIRKVLGSTISAIMMILSKEFIILIIIANIIAGPIAYFLTHRWLQDYAYKISINWWIFGLAFCSMLMIALLTVSWQTIKATCANPIKALRDE